jgi:photosystem II stability/assembly factor-like uncharacterized protein
MLMAARICGLVMVVAAAGVAQTWTPQTSSTNVSLRGVAAVSPTVAWASGAGGTFLRTMDGGVTWHVRVVQGAAELDFRGVRALDQNTAWLLSSGPGDKSRIYKTTDGGANWKRLKTNADATGFWDALAFWDARRGVVLGDPVDGHFVILTTDDGGETWTRRQTPPALSGEGAFAASNSCLTLQERREVWFGTGGISGARVFHSQDAGQTWTVSSTPLGKGSAGTGLFSLAFADSPHGVAVGGDYQKPSDTQENIALTSDDGRTWTAPTGAHPNGYRSSVVYVGARRVWIAAGTSGSDISHDGGQTWTAFDSTGYNAVAATGEAVWAVGPQGHIARLQFK